MLVMRTIKDPPDNVSGFNIYHYGLLSDVCDLDDDSQWIVRKSTNVHITSQVERTEPDELAVEEHSGDDTECGKDSDKCEPAIHYDFRKHTSMEGEDSGELEPEVGTHSLPSDADPDPLAATTGDNDQEDCNERDDLDIQFVKVITT